MMTIKSQFRLKMTNSTEFVDLKFDNGLSSLGDEESSIPLDELSESGTSDPFQSEDEAELGTLNTIEDIDIKSKSESEEKPEVKEKQRVKRRKKAKKERPASKYRDLYFKEEDEFLCDACNAHYKSMHGVHTHLRNTVCGFGKKEGTQKKVQHTNHYTRVNDRLICDICGKVYNSLRGIYHHLANTACGKEERPEKPKTQPVEKTVRKEYMGFYQLNENSEYVCNTCQSAFKSHHGIRNHLIQKVCGFGQEEVKPNAKKCWSRYYHMDGESYVCSTCLRMFNNRTEVYRHLKITTGCIGDTSEPVTENMENKQKVAIKPVKVEVKPDFPPLSDTTLDIDLD